MVFDFDFLTFDDRQAFLNIVGEIRQPDLEIAPDGGATYLHRWHVLPPKGPANVYLHVQTRDDPERPLHDHPWDNCSVILSGGYKETLCLSEGEPHPDITCKYVRLEGDVIYRRAAQAHRLELLYREPYAMTLFTTGPKVRDWGFWYPQGWRDWRDVTADVAGRSVHKSM